METEMGRRVEQAVCGGAVAVDAQLVRTALPRRNPLGHKGNFGRVLIVGGSVGYTGAPVLAAMGALRTGTGLVFVQTPQTVYPIVAGRCLEAMVSPLKEDGMAELAGKDVCLLGPGLGRSREAEALVCRVMAEAECPVVLDADGLNAVSVHIDKLDGRRGRVTILTPHEGEFARLGGDLSHGDRLRGAKDFARTHGCILVLKGPATVTALPNGGAFVNTTGNCGMAKGGSGDVLGGMIASLTAQGLSPESAAFGAVWLHGRAGDRAAAEKGEYGMLPSDLVEKIPYAIKAVTGE